MQKLRFGKPKTVVLRDSGVYAELTGGLGNQLFVIATAYAYSLRYGKKLYLSKEWTGMKADRPSYWDTIFENIKRYASDMSNLKNLRTYVESTFGYQEIPDYKSNVYLKGYFQSPLYFEDFEEKVKEFLHIPESILSRVPNVSVNTVAVHIRRGDYLNHQDFHYIQGIQYYHSARARIEKELGFRPKYLYFSDDKDWVSKNFELEDGDSISELSTDYEEFAMMSKCSHFIIANSSFSWWAAYLSKTSTEKIVIAPSKWFASKGPQDYADIYCKDWIQIGNIPNSLIISHKKWKDEIVVDNDMSFHRIEYPEEKGTIYINGKEIVCLWDKYNPESTYDEKITVNNLDILDTLMALQNKHIESRISTIDYKSEDFYNLYLINLEHRNDRRDQFLTSFKDYPFNVNRFKAIKHSKGYLGCSLSHLYLVKYAKEKNLPYIIVAEDDCLIKSKPEEVKNLLNVLTNNLDKWNIFNGAPTFGGNKDFIIDDTFDDSILSTNWGQSTAFMIYNKSVYDMLLNFNFTLAIDVYIAKKFTQHIYNKVFAIQRASYSDIELHIQGAKYEQYFIEQHSLALSRRK